MADEGVDGDVAGGQDQAGDHRGQKDGPYGLLGHQAVEEAGNTGGNQVSQEAGGAKNAGDVFSLVPQFFQTGDQDRDQGGNDRER